MKGKFLNQKLGKRASRQAALQKAKLEAERIAFQRGPKKTALQGKPFAPRPRGEGT